VNLTTAIQAAREAVAEKAMFSAPNTEIRRLYLLAAAQLAQACETLEEAQTEMELIEALEGSK